MNQVFTAVWTFVKKNPYSVLLTLFILWMCIGIFPLRCYVLIDLFCLFSPGRSFWVGFMFCLNFKFILI